jgi:putative ubiquitin-RnfH superfamily antitoxin RatB of RatAB toxin-antitoxin module
MAPAETLHVEVVYCPQPGQTDSVQLTFGGPATVADALRASGVLERHGLALDSVRAGIWCKVRELGVLLRDHDRVEVYRPLIVDPKEARRLRYKGRNKATDANGSRTR